MRIRTSLALPLLLIAAACERSPLPALERGYVLATVNGAAVPAAVDTFPGTQPGQPTLYRRVLGRTLEILSRDSARYTVAGEMRSGELAQVECASATVPLARSGARLVLPAVGMGGGPVPPYVAGADTLTVADDGRLVQVKERPAQGGRPAAHTLRFEYVAARSAVPAC